MKILGFRAEPQSPRYAIVEVVDGDWTLLNTASENKLVFPAQCNEDTERLNWFYRELERIFHCHDDISRVVIKTNEYAGTENAAKRRSSYIEGTLLLYCGQKNIPAFLKTYASLGAKTADVKARAAERVGQTAKYWDNKMADAVVAAWWGGRNP